MTYHFREGKYTVSQTYEKIYQIVRKIPFGQVATYGQIAFLAGNPRWSRVVGYALRVAPNSLPCHRVLYQNGALSDAFMTEIGNQQRLLLEAEGVQFLEDGRVDLHRFLWRP